MIEQIIKIGWQAVEIGFLVVAICVLLSMIVGPDSGYIASVSDNAQKVLQALPAGVILGGAVIVAVYSWARTR
jgi:hypothetical protein